MFYSFIIFFLKILFMFSFLLFPKFSEEIEERECLNIIN